MNSSCGCKTVWIRISWLLMKPADLDLHCFNGLLTLILSPVISIQCYNFIINIDSSCGCKTVCNLISWPHQKPADLDLHCFHGLFAFFILLPVISIQCYNFIINIDSSCGCKTVCIRISWLHWWSRLIWIYTVSMGCSHLSYPQPYQYSVIISLLISTHHVDVKQCGSRSAGF